ncbi:membrane-bound acid phosphatase 2 [Trypanosoma brucei equiperdum]|uniref:Membrane-bound acid phosphatase 2 n=1 Tax=Trypanosoma brucei equiperdum TaxID=630700 RepID=A0A3L6KV33_9TRYP|nr:membrane-bound acid phosphatase 2 [Trypanosoma brucei equiperdum]
MKERKGSWVNLAVVCVFFTFLHIHSYAAQPTKTLHLVQLVHRHGARYPLVPHNATEICGGEPCGSLTREGLTMLINTGKFLREHYNNASSVPFFPSTSYNLSVSHTESTYVNRTIQSAEGLLKGLFPDENTFFPVVYTRYDRGNVLQRSYSNPYTYAFLNLDVEWWRNVCNPTTDKFIKYDTLLSISKEVFSEGMCANPEDRCKCAQTLFDIGASMEADGRIAKHPLLLQHVKQLRNVTEFCFREEFGYNSSDKTHVNMGSQGQDLAQRILFNAESRMNGTTTLKLYHYSAHDVTLAPLAATLGDSTFDGFLPPFGQLYAFELLYDDAANGYVVCVRRGAPGQTPSTKYLFQWDDFQLKYMDERNSIYNAENNTCPYHDFKRFVDFTKPKDPAGLCYLNDKYRKLFDCSGEKRESPNQACKALRRMCPEWACGSGYTLNSVTLECIQSLSGGRYFTMKWRLLLVFIVLVCVCVVVSLLCFSRNKERREEEPVIEEGVASNEKEPPLGHPGRANRAREGSDGPVP